MKNTRLKRARQEKGLSQKELAEAVGATRQTIGMIEAGNFNPSLRICTDICKVLGKTLDELFWEEENMAEEKNRERTEAMEPEKIYSAAERIEAEMLMEILRNNNIPCFKKGIGAGGYMDIYAGNSIFGEDIYVDRQDADRAREILEGVLSAADVEEAEGE